MTYEDCSGCDCDDDAGCINCCDSSVTSWDTCTIQKLNPTPEGPYVVPCNWAGPFCENGSGDYRFKFTYHWESECEGSHNPSTTADYTCAGTPPEPVLCPPPNNEANWFVDGRWIVANLTANCNQCGYDGDNDGDGCSDAADSDCGGTESGCANGIDDDCDGFTDGADTDCDTGEICGNGLDDESTPDGLIDEADPECCVWCEAANEWDLSGGNCPGASDFLWEAIPPQETYCCGDDPQEDYRYFDQLEVTDCDDIASQECVGRNDDTNDDACCSVNTDCVLNGVCYQNVTGPFDIDGDGIEGETCSGAGQWRDCDAGSTLCTLPRCGSLNWTAGGESAAFGEYNTGTATECCGDDINESLATSTDYVSIEVPPLATSACCDNADDCVHESICYTTGDVADVDLNSDTDICLGGVWLDCIFDSQCGAGLCCDGAQNCTPCGNEFVCDDTIDNDGDTFIDQDDPDCCGNCSGVGLWWDMGAGGCAGEDFDWESVPPQTESCCGDDSPLENYTYFDVYAADGCNDITNPDCVGRNDDPADDVCCNASTDCVMGGVCYQNATGPYDLDGDGVLGEFCMLITGQWRDCDANASLCILPRCGSRNWTTGGEAAAFGEYDAGTASECCGDDAGEYFTLTGLNTSCCNTATDCVDSLGKCQVNDIWSPGGCTDGIDSDCDGFIDFVPTDGYADDPDCRAVINGTLTYENGTLITGVNVTVTAGATDPVTGVYVEFTNVTAAGAYSLNVIVNLTYNIVARLQTGGIAYNWSVLVDESNGRTVTVNLIVRTAEGCEPDCTLSGEDYCRPECDGMNGCLFDSGMTMQACDGSQTGWIIPYDGNSQVECCEGSLSERSQARILGVRGARDVVRVTRIISYGGQLITLVIDVFQ